MSTRFRSIVQIQGINPYVLAEAPVADRLRAGWRTYAVLARQNDHPAAGIGGRVYRLIHPFVKLRCRFRLRGSRLK